MALATATGVSFLQPPKIRPSRLIPCTASDTGAHLMGHVTRSLWQRRAKTSAEPSSRDWRAWRRVDDGRAAQAAASLASPEPQNFPAAPSSWSVRETTSSVDGEWRSLAAHRPHRPAASTGQPVHWLCSGEVDECYLQLTWRKTSGQMDRRHSDQLASPMSERIDSAQVLAILCLLFQSLYLLSVLINSLFAMYIN